MNERKMFLSLLQSKTVAIMNKEKTFRGEFLKGFAEDIPGRTSSINVLSGLFSAVWK